MIAQRKAPRQLAATNRLLQPGRITVLRGPAGCGKSTLAFDLAERMRLGTALPDGVRYPAGDALGSYQGGQDLQEARARAGLFSSTISNTQLPARFQEDPGFLRASLHRRITEAPSRIFVLDHWAAIRSLGNDLPGIVEGLRPDLRDNETALLVVAERPLRDKENALEKVADSVFEVVVGKPAATMDDEAEIALAGCLMPRKGAGLPLRFRILGDRYSGVVTWLPW